MRSYRALPVRSSHLLLAVLLLAAVPASAGPAVLLYPALGRAHGVVLQGRVLKEAPSAGSSVLSRNLRRLTAPAWECARVEISFQGATATVTSGDEGHFEVNLPPPEGTSFATGFALAQAKAGGAEATVGVEIIPDDSPFLVISDFDDTLAVSHVTQPAKLMESALLRDADSQEVVPGMADFYGCLRAPAAPAFALVSGSPVQYVPRVAAFLGRHRFPPFALYLRNLGPGTLSNYKQPTLRRLLREFPQPVVLVGDSGEKDPEIYAQIREEFPGRVKAIYIRDAGRTGKASRFQDMVLFREARDAAGHAVKSGLADAACVLQAFPPEAPTAGNTVP
ncbi:App1 family protein [Stigmatella erecta]|uniref:App1 family protein n=1 Tax=Stigmatella erecta TaxID=83460 RepID=UPI001FE7B5B3|nr:phosphatase domain-containing protein [Stigmatella erecta]